MSEEKAIAFHKLVAEMRTNQREFWKTRDKDLLKKSIELEKRVDEIILHADGNDVPEDDNGSFFLEVAQLRASSRQYFQLKKIPGADQQKRYDLYNAIKKSESKIDSLLIKWQDAQYIKQGYIIEYHVMERYPRAMAHSVFSSQDENLAKIEYNDYLRRCQGGVMYYQAKKYLPPKGMPPIEDKQ